MKAFVNLRHLAEFFLEWEMFLKSRTENQNSHFIFNNFFPPKNLAAYDTMWKNVAQSDRLQMLTQYGKERCNLYAR
jgi:hypothetical protein